VPKVRSGNIDIHWDQAGEGPPVLLLHGFTETSETIWVAGGWVDALCRSGRRVVRLDLRAHGGSGAPRDPADYSAQRLLGDVEAVARAAGISRADLIGFSLGGELALRYAMQHGSARVRRAAIISLGRAFLRPRARSSALSVDGLRAEDPSGLHPTVQKFRARILERGLDRLAAAALLAGDRPPPDPAELERIALPVLFVSGELERMVGDAQPLADLVPGSKLVRIAGADHDGAVFSPKTQAEVLEFLGPAGS